MKKDNEKSSPEMNRILNAIDNFVKKNDGNVCFHAGFFVFDKEGDVKEDRLLAYGIKNSLLISGKELLKMMKKEKKDFINW